MVVRGRRTAVVPHRRPQPPGPGLAGGQDRNRRVVGMDPRASADVHLDCVDERLQGGGDRAHPVGERRDSIGTPSRPKRSLCRGSGRCSPNFKKATSARRFASARPRLIGWTGAGGRVIVSHDRQENFSRTCWMTNQRGGTRSASRRRPRRACSTRPRNTGTMTGPGRPGAAAADARAAAAEPACAYRGDRAER